MPRVLITLLAEGALFLLVVFMPILAVTFTDWFRHTPRPQHYAVLLAMAAAAGALLFVPAITIVAVTALLALGLAWLSARYALEGLTYRRALHPARLFAGDTAELVLHLRNGKIFPLAWLSVVDPIQINVFRINQDMGESLRISGGLEELDSQLQALVTRTAIGPFQEVRRTYQVEGIRRGVYTVGPATVRTGDPFGLFQRETEMGGRTEIVVYPRVHTLDTLNLPYRDALGEMVVRRALVEDPVLLAGSREYRPDDPLRRIHWKQTARTGELQVRIADPSTTAQLMIVANLNTFQHLWEGVDLERMEAAISVAASLGVWALDRDFATGLRTNGTIAGAEITPRLAPSAHPRQATRLLEHLARVSYSGRHTPEYILTDEARRLGAGASLIFVTPIITRETIAALTARTLAGRVSVVYCGRHAAPVIRGVPVHLALPPEVARAAS